MQLQAKSGQSKKLSEVHRDTAAADTPKEKKLLESSLGRESFFFEKSMFKERFISGAHGGEGITLETEFY